MGNRVSWLVYLYGAAIIGSIAPVFALENSVGESGIKANRLHEAPYNLLGRKIGIGQVEIGRPVQFGRDKSAVNNTITVPQRVFFRDRPAKSDTNVDGHASMVAGVMIAKDKYLLGVAPEAKLYSAAVGSLKEGGQTQECVATQHIALQNGGDIRAINFSFGESLERDSRSEPRLDGKALLTKCIDWSSRVHDTLYVIAGNQGTGGIPIPTDNYNGIVAAYSTKRQGIFKKVDFANLSALPLGIGRSIIKKEIDLGSRRAISLLAPGSQIEIRNQKGAIEKVSGTSFAAPHVTASVALLQEYADRQLRLASKPEGAIWGLAARRHEVMKVVLLNSTDKIQDNGDGLLLDMERTTINEKNQTWLESDAYHNPRIPLDIQMGTGHLNIYRAYRQFSNGQQSASFPVEAIGWDYDNIEVNSYRDYELKSPLVKGSHVAISLAWDRLVTLEDRNHNRLYDIGEDFRDRGLNNLDVYLLPASETSTLRYTCSSLSLEDSIEHIFCPIPATDKYKIRVYYRHQLNEPKQSYALAWWTVTSLEE